MTRILSNKQAVPVVAQGRFCIAWDRVVFYGDFTSLHGHDDIAQFSNSRIPTDFARHGCAISGNSIL